MNVKKRKEKKKVSLCAAAVAYDEAPVLWALQIKTWHDRNISLYFSYIDTTEVISPPFSLFDQNDTNWRQTNGNERAQTKQTKLAAEKMIYNAST